MHSARAVSVGEDARELLGSGGMVGEVHSVFGHTINVVSEGGDLVTVACRAADDSPINLRVESPSFDEKTRPSEGSPVVAREDSVSLGGVLTVNGLGEAPTWRPEVSLPQDVEARGLLESLLTAVDAVKLYGRTEGFKPLVPHICGLMGVEPGASPLWGRNPYAEAALPRVEGLVGLLELGDAWGAAREASGLVGLGPGLTPSGDDFLCGLLGSLSVASPLFGDLRSDVEEMNRMVFSSVDGRTNPISRGILKHYAGGRPSGSASELIQGLLDRCDSGIEESVRGVCRAGHSSGTDLVVGVLTAFAVLYRRIRGKEEGSGW